MKSMATPLPDTELASEALWHREQRRRALLPLLGIEPLISVRSAPAAADIERLVAPGRPDVLSPAPESPDSTSQAITSQATKSAAAAASSSGIAALRKSLSDGQPTGIAATDSPQRIIGEQTTSTTAGSAAEASVSAEDTPQFHLLIATAGRWLWVEALDDGLLRREQLQLVQAMARALAGPTATLSHRQFDWPLADHPHLPRDSGAARQSVAGQLQRLAQEHDARGLIILGDRARGLLLAPAGMTVVESPSTAEMLAMPTTKRDAWQALKPHVEQ